MPPRSAVTKIRQALTDDLEGFEEIVKGRTFRRRFGDLDTDGMLTRLPRGFSADHPAAAWLRYQSFTAFTALTSDEVTSPTLPQTLAKHYAVMGPFVRWLNAAMGLGVASSR